MEVGKNNLYLDTNSRASSIDFAKANVAKFNTKALESVSNVASEIDTADVNFSGVGDLVDLASSNPGQVARDAKVESLKAAVENGSYLFDSGRIAEETSLIKAIFG